MLVVAAASYFLRRNRREIGRGVGIALLVAGLVMSAGTLVQTALIGHSGAKAAWSDVATGSSQGSDDQGSGSGDSDGE
jgi:hypothetical protein